MKGYQQELKDFKMEDFKTGTVYLENTLSDLEFRLSNLCCRMQSFLQDWDKYSKYANQINIVTAKHGNMDSVIKSTEILKYEELVKNTSAQFLTAIKILQLSDEDIQRKKFESQLKKWESVASRLKSRIENLNQFDNIYSIEKIEQIVNNIKQQQHQQSGSINSTEEIGLGKIECEERMELLNKLLGSLKSIETKKNSEELEKFSVLHRDIQSMLRSSERDLDDLKILKEISIESENKLHKLNWGTKNVQHRLEGLQGLETKISRNAILVSSFFLVRGRPCMTSQPRGGQRILG